MQCKNVYYNIIMCNIFFSPFLSAEREYWYEEARVALKKRLAGYEGKMGRAKNVVFLVGDGMGASTLTASRIFKGQRQGNQGEEEQLLWDTFPAVAMAKVGWYVNYFNVLIKAICRKHAAPCEFSEILRKPAPDRRDVSCARVCSPSGMFSRGLSTYVVVYT